MTSTGVYTFIVRAGIFDLAGLEPLQSNQGLFDWTGTAHAIGLQTGESLGVTPSNSRFSPFNFGPATTFGGRLSDPSTITNVDCARDVSGGAKALWRFDTNTNMPAPMPTVPDDSVLGNFAPRGIDSYTNVWRFTVSISSLAGPDLTILFFGQAGPVLRWVVFGSVQPYYDDDMLQDGNVSFLGLTPQPQLHDYSPVALTLIRVPAPGRAVPLLLLFGTARRRR